MEPAKQSSSTKRKVEDEVVVVVVDPPAKSAKEEPLIDPVHWRAFDSKLWNAGEYAGRSKFGKFGTRLYGPDKRPAVVKMPRMTVAFEPSAWTEEKEEMMRKKGKVVKSPLAADRTTDKWTLQCFVSEEVEAWYRGNVEEPLCEDIFEQGVYPNVKSAEAVSGKLSESSIVKTDDQSGRPVMTFQMKSERGATVAPMKLFDADTLEPLPDGTKLGRGSEVNVLCNFSESFCGAQLSVYAKPLAVYVSHLVRPANLDPKAYRVGRFED